MLEKSRVEARSLTDRLRVRPRAWPDRREASALDLDRCRCPKVGTTAPDAA